jgi:transposase
MRASAPAPVQAAMDTSLAAIYVSLELSRASWLVTSLSPGRGEKMSKHSVDGGDIVGLLNQLANCKPKRRRARGNSFRS